MLWFKGPATGQRNLESAVPTQRFLQAMRPQIAAIISADGSGKGAEDARELIFTHRKPARP